MSFLSLFLSGNKDILFIGSIDYEDIAQTMAALTDFAKPYII